MYTYFYRRRDKVESPAMAPRKVSKATVEVSGQGSDNVSDTSPRSVDSVRTWSYIFEVLQSELVDVSDDSSGNEKDDLITKYKIIVQAQMHKVAARPCLLPYYDMVWWALDHVDIPTRTIINEQRVTIGNFRLCTSFQPCRNLFTMPNSWRILNRRNVCNTTRLCLV
jgi:hypothetical protein